MPSMDFMARTSGPAADGGRVWYRGLAFTVIYGFLFLTFFELGSFFALSPGGSLWYPAAGLRMAVLIIFSWRVTPGLVVGEILAVALYGAMKPGTRYDALDEVLLVGQLPMIYGIGAFVLSRYTSFDSRLTHVRDMVLLAAGALAIPIAGASESRLVQILMDNMPAKDFVVSTLGFFIGDTIGILMLTPPLLLLWSRYQTVKAIPTEPRTSSTSEPHIVVGRQLLVDFLVIWVVLAVLHLLPSWFSGLASHAHWYLAFLPMIWISFRHGLIGSVAGTVALTSGAAWLFYLPVDSIRFHELQILVVFLALASLFMGSAISTQRRAEHRLDQQNRELLAVQGQLEGKNEELARFNYTVAHDLKNPVVTITNFLGLLRRDVVAGKTERLGHNLDRLETAAGQMRHLLEELFEFSRVDVKSNPFVEIPLAELVREALADLAEPITERGVEVEVAVNLPLVSCDRVRLLEVLRHLLANAVWYMGDQPSPRIEVGLRGGGPPPAPSVFYVRDNGVGIATQYHDKVFGLFERLEPAASKGSGVGLALVKRIIELHGGRIWVESEGAGKGSTFCFTLRPDDGPKHAEQPGSVESSRAWGWSKG